MVQRVVSTNTFGIAKFVVSSDATQGTHTTIQAAINDASSGDSILVRAGSYNENLTLKAGVTLFTGLAQGTPNIGAGGVVLTQGCTLPLTGQCVFQGFYFNFGATANMIADIAGGSAASITMYDCGWNFGGGVPFSCANGQTNIRLYNCIGNNTSGTFFTIASGGTFQCYNCTLLSALTSPSASLAPSGSTVYYYDSKIGFPTNLTAATFSASNCLFFTSSSAFPIGAFNNNTVITTATSGTYEFKNCQFASGSASAISIGSGTTVKLSGASDVNSSNTNAITGAGTLQAANVNFSGTSSFVNVTTQTVGAAPGWKGAVPASGMIGEQIRSYIPTGSGVSLVSGTAKTITSISLTAGIWDISALGNLLPAASTTTTQFTMSISTTNNTLTGNFGDSDSQNNIPLGAQQTVALCVPSFRVSLTSTTTYYLVMSALFATSTCVGYGRISATRVG